MQCVTPGCQTTTHEGEQAQQRFLTIRLLGVTHLLTAWVQHIWNAYVCFYGAWVIAANSEPLLYATCYQDGMARMVEKTALARWSSPASSVFALVQPRGVIGYPSALSKSHGRGVNGAV